MPINDQRYAFFKYSPENLVKVSTYCKEQYTIGFPPDDPNMIRVQLLPEMQYIVCKTMGRASHRPVLEDWVLDALITIPTPEARVLFVTELYDEQHISRENESNGRSKAVSSRPWL